MTENEVEATRNVLETLPLSEKDIDEEIRIAIAAGLMPSYLLPYSVWDECLSSGVRRGGESCAKPNPFKDLPVGG